jgi:DNA topoisomerase-1
MPKGAKIETVTLEEALKAFELPREVGTTPEGETIKANIGRFGPYIQVGKTFVSIKPLDPHTITEAEAREFYAEKLKKDAEKFIQQFSGGVQVLNGRYGPYITDGKKNAKIPKDKDPAKLTEIEAKDLLAATSDKKKSFRGRAGARAKK